MKSFKEIYNKRRTRYYIPDKKGEYRYDPLTGDYVSIKNPNNYWLRDRQTYRRNTKPDTTIIGTALAFTTALWIYLTCSPSLWVWFKGIVTDGYWLIWLSPIILIYWAFASVLYLPITIISGGLVIISVYWTVFIEFPASILNKEEIPAFINPSDVFWFFMINAVILTPTIILSCTTY